MTLLDNLGEMNPETAAEAVLAELTNLLKSENGGLPPYCIKELPQEEPGMDPGIIGRNFILLEFPDSRGFAVLLRFSTYWECRSSAGRIRSAFNAAKAELELPESDNTQARLVDENCCHLMTPAVLGKFIQIRARTDGSFRRDPAKPPREALARLLALR